MKLLLSHCLLVTSILAAENVDRTADVVKGNVMSEDQLKYPSQGANQTSACTAAWQKATDLLRSASQVCNSLWPGSSCDYVAGNVAWASEKVALCASTTFEEIQMLHISLQHISLWHTLIGSGNGSFHAWTSQDQSDLWSKSENLEVMSGETAAGLNYFVVEGDMLIEKRGLPHPWDNGIVKYCFHDSVPKATQDLFDLAVKMMQLQVADNRCLQIIQIQSDSSGDCVETPSVLVTRNHAGCFSHFGQVSGMSPALMHHSQILNLDENGGCDFVGMILHQLLHTLGIGHQATHSDRSVALNFQDLIMARDSHVSLMEILPEKANPSNYPFDHLSIMMHPPSAFTGYVMLPSQANLSLLALYMGQRMSMTEQDVRSVASFYQCQNLILPTYPTIDLNKNLMKGKGLGQRLGECRDKAYTGLGWIGSEGQKHASSCIDLRNKCMSIPLIANRTKQRCPNTCLQCIQVPTSFQTLGALPAHKTAIVTIPGKEFDFMPDDLNLPLEF